MLGLGLGLELGIGLGFTLGLLLRLRTSFSIFYYLTGCRSNSHVLYYILFTFYITFYITCAFYITFYTSVSLQMHMYLQMCKHGTYYKIIVDMLINKWKLFKNTSYQLSVWIIQTPFVRVYLVIDVTSLHQLRAA